MIDSMETGLGKKVDIVMEEAVNSDHSRAGERFKEHLDNKYSKDGYIRLWIPNSPNAIKLNELRNLITQPDKLREAFERIFTEEST